MGILAACLFWKSAGRRCYDEAAFIAEGVGVAVELEGGGIAGEQFLAGVVR